MKDNTLRFLRMILFLIMGALGIFVVQTLAELLFTGLSLPDCQPSRRAKPETW